MEELLVAHNYHLNLDPHSREEGKPYPPLGTVVVASSLAAAGYSVTLYDATFAESVEEFRVTLESVRPGRLLLVADNHSVPQKMCLIAQRQAAFTMIQLARGVGCRVLASGPDVTDQPGLYLEAGASVVIRGEPDQAILDYCSGVPVAEIEGAMEAGAPLAQPAPPMKSLNALSAPDWSLVDMDCYRKAWQEKHGYWEGVVSSARGCPYRCNWCAKPIWGRAFSMAPAEAVVQEMLRLKEYGCDQVWFSDDIFGLKRSWLHQFRAELEKESFILPYRCLSRADLICNPGTVADLKATGCKEVWLGAESGSQTVLDAMDKDVAREQIDLAVLSLRKAGIRVGLFLQLGYPGERRRDVHRTIGMVRKLRPDALGISVSYPLPGTPFYERVKDKLLATNWETAMDCELLFKGEYPQEFYTAARDVLRREHSVLMGFRSIKKVLKFQQQPGDLRRIGSACLYGPQLPVHHLRMNWHSRAGSNPLPEKS